MSEKIGTLKGAAGLGDGFDSTYEGGPFVNNTGTPIAGERVLEGLLAGSLSDPHPIEAVVIQARVALQDPQSKTLEHEIRWHIGSINVKRIAASFSGSFASFMTDYLLLDPELQPWTSATLANLRIGCEVNYTLDPGESFDLRLSEIQLDVYARSWISATALAGPSAAETGGGAIAVALGAGPQAAEAAAGPIGVGSLAGPIATETRAD